MMLLLRWLPVRLPWDKWKFTRRLDLIIRHLAALQDDLAALNREENEESTVG